MRELILLSCVLLCSSCNRGESQKVRMSPEDRRDAQALIARNCAACHQVPGVPAAKGRVGPALTQMSHQQTVAGHFLNTPQNLIRWIEHPQDLLPGDVMPEMGLTHEQARKIATFLYAVE